MQRWTIRGIDPDVIDMVHEVADTSNLTIGEVVNEAIIEWYDALPFEDAGGRDVQASPDEQTMVERHRFWIPGKVEFEEASIERPQ